MARILGVKDIESVIPHRELMRLPKKVIISDDGIIEGFFRDGVNDDIVDPSDMERCFCMAIEACAQSAAVGALMNKEDRLILFESISDLEVLCSQNIDLRNARYIIEKDLGDDKSSYIKVTNGSQPYFKGKISCKMPRKKILPRIIQSTTNKSFPYISEKEQYDSGDAFRDTFFSELRIIDVEPESMTIGANLSEDSPILQGHFPGQPIMPGVFMLYLALKAIGNRDSKNLKKIQEFKFLSPIIPPSIIKINICAENSDYYEVMVLGNGLESAKGILEYE